MRLVITSLGRGWLDITVDPPMDRAGLIGLVPRVEAALGDLARWVVLDGDDDTIIAVALRRTDPDPVIFERAIAALSAADLVTPT